MLNNSLSFTGPPMFNSSVLERVSSYLLAKPNQEARFTYVDCQHRTSLLDPQSYAFKLIICHLSRIFKCTHLKCAGEVWASGAYFASRENINRIVFFFQNRLCWMRQLYFQIGGCALRLFPRWISLPALCTWSERNRTDSERLLLERTSILHICEWLLHFKLKHAHLSIF